MEIEKLGKIAKLTKNFVEEVYFNNWGKYPTSHDYLHILRVLRISNYIAENEKLSFEEKFLLEIACLLHDIAIPLKSSKENHAIESSKIAFKFLSKLELDEKYIDLICSAIAEHSWSKQSKSSSKISAILQDADRIDALGTIGFARMIIYGEYMKRKLHHPNEIIPRNREINDNEYTLDHVYTKLIKIPEKMNTKIGRKIAEIRIKKLISLIEEFEREFWIKDL